MNPLTNGCDNVTALLIKEIEMVNMSIESCLMV